MAVTLLEVGAHLSLEMDSSDFERVRAHLRGTFPDYRTRPAGIAKIVEFGGARFTFQDDWDDPCFISSSPDGDALLRRVHAELVRED